MAERARHRAVQRAAQAAGRSAVRPPAAARSERPDLTRWASGRTRLLRRYGRTAADVVALAECVLARAEREMAAARRADPPVRPPACQRGCAWCCYLLVPVSVPEVVLLAQYLRDTRSAAELEALIARLASHASRTGGATAAEYLAARLPCPLLVDGACSAYHARPLACRGWNSYDAHVCHLAVETAHGPLAHRYPPQTAVTDSLLAGLAASPSGATRDCDDAPTGAGGQVDGRLALVAALQIALEIPDAAERWLAGDPVFAPAALPPNAFAALSPRR